jgi:enamine deaminase RidA (YjgF/YER057c/UK114 family)
MNRTLLLLFVTFLALGVHAQDDPVANLKKLGITLPKPATPIANYVTWNRTGNLIYLSGAGPTTVDGQTIKGKLGVDLDVKAGYEAAKAVGIQLLAVLQEACGGDLRKVKHVIKAFGMVNSAPDFTQQPAVINGFSDLMVAVFGEKGKHARSAVGMAALPNNIAVEIELIVEVE